MDPLGAVSFISPQSIAGSSVPQLIINWEEGEEGRQAGLLFLLLKEDCQQNNSPQLKSQYISWSLVYGGAQLLSKTLNEKEIEEVLIHRVAYNAKHAECFSASSNIFPFVFFVWLVSTQCYREYKIRLFVYKIVIYIQV